MNQDADDPVDFVLCMVSTPLILVRLGSLFVSFERICENENLSVEFAFPPIVSATT